jgi:cytidylate kinase
VAIDGAGRCGKQAVGALLAHALGGVLVDSARFYRAVALACVDAGINLEVESCVVEFCSQAAFDVCTAEDGGRVLEAVVNVKGRWFTKRELLMVESEATRVARVFTVRQIVNQALARCERFGRVVMVGRDIGGAVMPKAPFKFFLDGTLAIPENQHARRKPNDGFVLYTDDALMLNAENRPASEVCQVILEDMLSRAGDLRIRDRSL